MRFWVRESCHLRRYGHLFGVNFEHSRETMTEKGQVLITAQVPESLHREARRYARNANVTIREIVIDALRNFPALVNMACLWK